MAKKSLDSVLDKSIILTITAPNDNAKSISVQCAPAPLVFTALPYHVVWHENSNICRFWSQSTNPACLHENLLFVFICSKQIFVWKLKIKMLIYCRYFLSTPPIFNSFKINQLIFCDFFSGFVDSGSVVRCH